MRTIFSHRSFFPSIKKLGKYYKKKKFFKRFDLLSIWLWARINLTFSTFFSCRISDCFFIWLVFRWIFTKISTVIHDTAQHVIHSFFEQLFHLSLSFIYYLFLFLKVSQLNDCSILFWLNDLKSLRIEINLKENKHIIRKHL